MSTFGKEKKDIHPDPILTQHFSLSYAKTLTNHVLKRINQSYFRCQFYGFENPIKRGKHPAIVFSNHSGMAFPWDAILFISMSFDYYDQQVKHGFRALIDKQLSRLRIMNPFMAEHLWLKAGGITATYKNFEKMMTVQDGNILIYPEGVPGISKGFDKKYELQRFSTSFVKMALKYDVPLFPVATINAEYVNPFVYASRRINKLVQKIGIPFLPIGWALIVLVFQPWMFYFSLPANITYVRGAAIQPSDLSTKPYETLVESDFLAMSIKMNAHLQHEIDKAVEKYGDKPFRFKDWCKSAWKHKDFLACLPFFWPFLFVEFHRQWNKGKEIKLGKGIWYMMKTLVRNPIIICYYLPIIGWIPIIWKGKKRYKF